MRAGEGLVRDRYSCRVELKGAVVLLLEEVTTVADGTEVVVWVGIIIIVILAVFLLKSTAKMESDMRKVMIRQAMRRGRR